MKTKINAIFLLPVVALMALCGCNASTPTPDEGDYGTTAITSFSLKANDKVLPNLDSVFFSIDLIKGEIYNADSLPAGTDVSHLVVKIGTPEVNECKITYRIPGTLTDTTISHIAAPNDSINFEGPVSVEIISLNRQNTRRYRLEVNVHREHPDSLVWSGIGESPMALPTSLSTITASRTIQQGVKALCLTTDGSASCLAQTTDPENNQWQLNAITLPAEAQISSFNALGDSLYILSGNNLYASGDMGNSWHSTGAKMDYVYGSTGEYIIGNVKEEVRYFHVTYPATMCTEVSEKCPIRATGDLVTYNTIWNQSPTSIFVGGELADGTLSGDCWGFDGMTWEKISRGGVAPVQGVSLIPYFTFKVNTSTWNFTKESILLALGGRNANGNCENQVSVSYDCGIHWQPADSLLNIPDFIPGFEGSQALIFDQEITSRAVKPITEWTCPYIYLFGGRDAKDKALATRWRGVVSRLMFKPLYSPTRR